MATAAERLRAVYMTFYRQRQKGVWPRINTALRQKVRYQVGKASKPSIAGVYGYRCRKCLQRIKFCWVSAMLQSSLRAITLLRPTNYDLPRYSSFTSSGLRLPSTTTCWVKTKMGSTLLTAVMTASLTVSFVWTLTSTSFSFSIISSG